jgi:predicted nucleotidyltransferase
MLKPEHELLAHLVAQVLAEYPDGVAIYRFGSWGTANQRRDSDIDTRSLRRDPYLSSH